MKTCKTCKYWKKVDTKHLDFVIGDCDKIETFWNSTKWNEDYIGRTRTERNKNDLAFVQDGSDYYAVLKTTPDYGCVHHCEVDDE